MKSSNFLSYRLVIVSMLIQISFPGFSQSKYPITYLQLKEFEGLYEYENNTTLKIAASPKETILYAVIGESMYPLRPIDKDAFLNNSNTRVQFHRNQSGIITGYSDATHTFKIINKNVSFPKEIWYPRIVDNLNTFRYQYQKPAKRNDGVEVGHIKDTPLDSALLNKMMIKIVDGSYPKVHSILIIKDDKLVFEEYFYEYNESTLHQLRSATKSVVSALAGIAIDKEIIKSKDEAVLSYLPEYNLQNMSDDKKRITLEHLLTNKSGLDYDISNDKAIGNEVAMGKSDDWVKYTLDLPMVEAPGGEGRYNSGNPIIMGRIIEKTSGLSLPDFANNYLFKPLGIRDYKWYFKPDRSSIDSYCQLYLRPRDMAKIGLLYLNNGRYNGNQILSPEWVKQTFTKYSVVDGVDYGYLWRLKWLNAGGIKYHGMAAQGNGGQRIFLWPEQNMVTVITGGSYMEQSPSDQIVREFILPAFNKN